MTGAGYAIVGGGIAGAAVAYHLSRRTSAPVVVYERGSPFMATTAKSFGLFGFYGDDLQRQMKHYSLRLYNRFLADPGDARHRPLGRLDVATSQAAASDLEATAGRSGAGEVEYVPGGVLPERLVTPLLDVDEIAGALYRPAVGCFTPRALAAILFTRAREQGATLRADTSVTGLATKAGRVVGIETPDGTIGAGAVVCAAGPWNPALVASAGIDLPLRHTLAPALRLRPDRPLGHRLPNASHVETGYSFRGADDGSVLVGHKPNDGYANGEVVDPDTVGDTVPGDLRSGALDAVARLFPRLGSAPVEEEWVGVRSETPDGNPIAGPTDVEGLSVVSFADSGIQLAPATGATVARHLLGGEPTPWDDGVTPDRFNE